MIYDFLWFTTCFHVFPSLAGQLKWGSDTQRSGAAKGERQRTEDGSLCRLRAPAFTADSSGSSSQSGSSPSGWQWNRLKRLMERSFTVSSYEGNFLNLPLLPASMRHMLRAEVQILVFAAWEKLTKQQYSNNTARVKRTYWWYNECHIFCTQWFATNYVILHCVVLHIIA